MIVCCFPPTIQYQPLRWWVFVRPGGPSGQAGSIFRRWLCRVLSTDFERWHIKRSTNLSKETAQIYNDLYLCSSRMIFTMSYIQFNEPFRRPSFLAEVWLESMRSDFVGFCRPWGPPPDLTSAKLGFLRWPVAGPNLPRLVVGVVGVAGGRILLGLNCISNSFIPFQDWSQSYTVHDVHDVHDRFWVTRTFDAGD